MTDVTRPKAGLAEEVHCRIAKRMKQLPVFTEAMTEDDSTSAVQ